LAVAGPLGPLDEFELPRARPARQVIPPVLRDDPGYQLDQRPVRERVLQGAGSVASWYPLSNIWGLSAIDMYASRDGLPYHFDGRRWSPMPNATGVSCNAFWSTSPSNIYCVSPRQVWKFNGSSWTALNPPISIGQCSCTTSSLKRIWGTSETDIYVVGAYAQLFGFDGTTWHTYYSHFESDEYDLNNIWAIGNSVFSVGDANFGFRGTP